MITYSTYLRTTFYTYFRKTFSSAYLNIFVSAKEIKDKSGQKFKPGARQCLLLVYL